MKYQWLVHPLVGVLYCIIRATASRHVQHAVSTLERRVCYLALVATEVG